MVGAGKQKVTRRSVLVGSLLLVVPSLAGCVSGSPPTATPPSGAAPAPATTQTPVTAQPAPKRIELQTDADIAKAEAEGALVYYGHDSEAGISALLDAFRADFPRIKTSYVRTLPGALYAKLIGERTAKAFQCDVLQISDVAAALDFQKNSGYLPYKSPHFDAYKPEFLSKPEGSYFWAGVTLAGIAINTTQVKAADAPRSWKDILDPKWVDGVSVNLASSGSQFVNWYILRGLYGKDFWKGFAKQRPRAFASNSQLYDRLAKADDRMCPIGEYPGYLASKEKGAPVDFVIPSEGITAVPSLLGIVSYAPHPQAARLFLDWSMSERGQSVLQSTRGLYYGSVRTGAPPMPTGVKVGDLSLLYPSDWADLVTTQKTFVEEWNAIIGM